VNGRKLGLNGYYGGRMASVDPRRARKKQSQKPKAPRLEFYAKELEV
jgi:hypothetical protein